MQFYQHERNEEQERPTINLTCPLMSTSGFDITAMKEYLTHRGLSFELAEANGWYPSRHAGDCFLRIVIPAVVTKDRHVYWQARAIDKFAHIRYQSPKGMRE